MHQQTKKTEKEKKKTSLKDEAVIIVFNDDENTFEWVISSFVEICELNINEAVEKTLYIHNNGQAVVCKGEYNDMKNKKDRLVERTIHALVTRPNLN